MEQLCLVCRETLHLKDKRGWNKKYCSDKCQRKANFVYSGFKEKGISTGTVGTMGEITVCLDLMEKGYDVFRAISPASNFDLVAFKNKKIITLEVRTGYIRNITKKLFFLKYPSDKAEYYAIVVYQPTRKIIYIPELPK